MVHSFSIHEAQCRDLFEKREEQKPLKERRKCPSDPMANEFRAMGANISGKQLDKLNSAAQQQWSTEVLAECRNCSRRFLPEKLAIHQRSCTVDNPSRRVNEPVRRGVVDSRLSASSTGISNSFGEEISNSSYGTSRTMGRQGGGDVDEIDSSGAILGLAQCPTCGRRFNDIAYEK